LQQRPHNLQFDVLSLAKLEVEKELLNKAVEEGRVAITRSY
jgi:hypothetical protein